MNLYKLNKNKLVYEQIQYKGIVLYVIIVAAIFTTLGFTGGIQVNTIIEKIPIIIRMEQEEFSEENLIKEIANMGFKYPKIVLAQSKLETNNFTSTIFKENNNLFGMKNSYLRPSTAACKNRQHAMYTTWQESLIDRAYWDAMYIREIKNENEYLQLLGELYAEDDLYIIKIKNLMK